MIIRLETDEIIIQRIAKTIYSFPFAFSFFTHFFGPHLVTKPILERIRKGKYERILEYYIDEVKVLVAGSEMSFNNREKEFEEILFQEKSVSNVLAASQNLQITKHKSDFFLSSGKGAISSKLTSPLGLCGTCWEIHEMTNLYKLFKDRKIDVTFS